MKTWQRGVRENKQTAALEGGLFVLDAGIFSGLMAPHLARVNREDNISVDHIIWTRNLNTHTSRDSNQVVDFALYVFE